MNQAELQSILPHRGNMLLIDEADVRDQVAYGKKHIRPDEWFLDGHFPGNPVVPGVILCEIMAQSCCVLLASRLSPAITPFFSGLNNVRFKHPVRPGDLVETRCEITKSRDPFYWAAGKTFVGGRLCASAEFSFALIQS